MTGCRSGCRSSAGASTTRACSRSAGRSSVSGRGATAARRFEPVIDPALAAMADLTAAQRERSGVVATGAPTDTAADAAGQKIAVELRGATKVFGKGTAHAVTALNELSLAIRDNEFFTLLGPSGCGKTTLLRAIAGFEELSAGEIYLLRPGDRPPAAEPAPGQHGLPALRAVSAHDGGAEHRLRAARCSAASAP